MRIKPLLLAGTLATGLLAGPVSAAGVTINGYIDVGYIASQYDYNGSTLQAVGSLSGNMPPNKSITLNDINIDMNAKLTDNVSAYASFNWLNGLAATVGIDYAWLNFGSVGPWDFNVYAGRIAPVYGLENRTYESNLNKFINMSLTSGVTVGSQDGISILGSFKPVNWAFSLTNGDNFGNAGTSIAARYAVNGLNGTQNIPPFPVGSSAVNGFDNNNSFAVSGRLSVAPMDGVEIGAWAVSDDARTTAAGTIPTKQNRRTLGADASYTSGKLGVKAEWVRAEEDSITAGSPIDLRSYYVELTYDILPKASVGVRYSRVKTDEAAGNLGQLQVANMQNEVSTLAFAGVYKLAEAVQIKAEYDLNDEHRIFGRLARDGRGTPINDVENDVFALSLVAGF